MSAARVKLKSGGLPFLRLGKIYFTQISGALLLVYFLFHGKVVKVGRSYPPNWERRDKVSVNLDLTGPCETRRQSSSTKLCYVFPDSHTSDVITVI